MTRPWAVRIGVLVALIVAGQIIFTLMDSPPRLVPWVLVATVVVTVLWLASDAFGLAELPWDEPLAAYSRGDAADDSVQHRVLSSHLVARDPSPALRDQLVALARARDPDLADPDLRALAEEPARRLTPSDIDRYLTRIEQRRDQS